MNTSLHKLTEGGTPIFTANSRNRKKDIMGVESVPLLLEIKRVWEEL